MFMLTGMKIVFLWRNYGIMSWCVSHVFYETWHRIRDNTHLPYMLRCNHKHIHLFECASAKVKKPKCSVCIWTCFKYENNKAFSLSFQRLWDERVTDWWWSLHNPLHGIYFIYPWTLISTSEYIKWRLTMLKYLEAAAYKILVILRLTLIYYPVRSTGIITGTIIIFSTIILQLISGPWPLQTVPRGRATNCYVGRPHEKPIHRALIRINNLNDTTMELWRNGRKSWEMDSSSYCIAVVILEFPWRFRHNNGKLQFWQPE
jgi:hypothetical protein